MAPVPASPTWLARGRSVIVLWLGATAIGGITGAASALFLFGLDLATRTRLSAPVLTWLLPVAGFVLGLVLERVGPAARRGTASVLDAANGGERVVPRLGGLVLFGTWWTHLFGGSAGREGTAVQVGGAVADAVAHLTPALAGKRTTLVLCGIAAGFGSVFGTPLAGALFGLEVVAPGRLAWRASLPCLWAAVVGDQVTRALGIHHTIYPAVAAPAFDWSTPLRWLAVVLAVAATAGVFLELTEGLRAQLTRRVPLARWRLTLGALLVVALWKAFGTDDYLGLGVPGILRALEDPSLPSGAFALKLLFTSATVGSGFLGGEVTPLFFIGASLGNALAPVVGLPLGLCAMVSLAALFGTASRAPLALAVMAAELAGLEVLPYAALVGVLACWLTGRRSLYQGQLP